MRVPLHTFATSFVPNPRDYGGQRRLRRVKAGTKQSCPTPHIARRTPQTAHVLSPPAPSLINQGGGGLLLYPIYLIQSYLLILSLRVPLHTFAKASACESGNEAISPLYHPTPRTSHRTPHASQVLSPQPSRLRRDRLSLLRSEGVTM